jgi:hypothetical protein
MGDAPGRRLTATVFRLRAQAARRERQPGRPYASAPGPSPTRRSKRCASRQPGSNLSSYPSARVTTTPPSAASALRSREMWAGKLLAAVAGGRFPTTRRSADPRSASRCHAGAAARARRAACSRPAPPPGPRRGPRAARGCGTPLAVTPNLQQARGPSQALRPPCYRPVTCLVRGCSRRTASPGE